jgi:hypothetical protein
MNDKFTCDYNCIDLDDLKFNDFNDSGNATKSFRTFYCNINNKKINFITPPIKFPYYYRFNPHFNSNNFMIPLDENDSNIISFYDKIMEIEKLISSNEFKSKYDIPDDYTCINIIKEFKGKKVLKTDIDCNNIDVIQSYTFKNNPLKVYTKKIICNTPLDIYQLIKKNTIVKFKIMPTKLWIMKQNKIYGLKFKIIGFNYNYENLVITNQCLKNNYSFQFVLLDENDINIDSD